MNKVPKEDKKALRQNPILLDVIERLKASGCVACGIIEQDGVAYIMLTRHDHSQGRSTTFKVGTVKVSAPEPKQAPLDSVYVHITMCEGTTGMVAMQSSTCAPQVSDVMAVIRTLLDETNKQFRLPKEHREMIADLPDW